MTRSVAPAVVMVVASAGAVVEWHDAVPEILLGLLTAATLAMVTQLIRAAGVMARVEQKLTDHIEDENGLVARIAKLEDGLGDLEDRLARRLSWNGKDRRRR